VHPRDVRPERAQPLEVLDRAGPGPLLDALDLLGEGALMHVQDRPVAIGQLLRLDDQFVGKSSEADDVDTRAARRLSNGGLAGVLMQLIVSV